MADVERWQGTADPRDARDPNGASASLEQIDALDKNGFGADRSRLLRMLALDGLSDPLVIRSSDAAPAGFVLSRRARIPSYIGPMIAPSADIAEALLDGMLGRLAGTEVCLDLHVGGALTGAMLARRGLSNRRGLTRMRFGARTSTGFGASICASAGPEYG